MTPGLLHCINDLMTILLIAQFFLLSLHNKYLLHTLLRFFSSLFFGSSLHNPDGFYSVKAYFNNNVMLSCLTQD